jgi:hypothetical protein
MPLRHEVRSDVLWIVVEGEYDDAELHACYERAFADPAFRDGMHLMIDSRKTLANPTRGELVERVRFLSSLRPRIGARCAVVVADTLHYGLARMFGAYGEPHGFEIRVFSDPVLAESWLLGGET